MRGEETCIRGGTMPALRDDFRLRQLFDNVRHLGGHVSGVREMHGRNSWGRRFDIGCQGPGKVQENFLEQFFLLRRPYPIL